MLQAFLCMTQRVDRYTIHFAHLLAPKVVLPCSECTFRIGKSEMSAHWLPVKNGGVMSCVKSPRLVVRKNAGYTKQLVKKSYTFEYWLVVSTPLKNISQLGLLFPIYVKIKNVPNHQSGSYTFE